LKQRTTASAIVDHARWKGIAPGSADDLTTRLLALQRLAELRYCLIRDQ
jgi:hypothetical protein